MNRHCKRRQPVKEAGFTLIELLMVVAIGGTLAAISVIGFAQAATSIRGDNGMVQVMSQLRMARDLAINQRRAMEVQFLAPNEIRVVRQEIPTAIPLSSTRGKSTSRAPPNRDEANQDLEDQTVSDRAARQKRTEL